MKFAFSGVACIPYNLGTAVHWELRSGTLSTAGRNSSHILIYDNPRLTSTGGDGPVRSINVYTTHARARRRARRARRRLASAPRAARSRGACAASGTCCLLSAVLPAQLHKVSGVSSRLRWRGGQDVVGSRWHYDAGRRTAGGPGGRRDDDRDGGGGRMRAVYDLCRVPAERLCAPTAHAREPYTTSEA
jgi:hypothetical protein